jgi:hypothetical protein
MVAEEKRRAVARASFLSKFDDFLPAARKCATFTPDS